MTYFKSELPKYSELTNDILIEVQPEFIADQVEYPNHFLFAYTILIKNLSQQKCQLMSRHWIITDGNGRVEEVFGDGVVGQQPVLAPGQSHVYSSFCPLTTPTGNMRGWYEFEVGEKNKTKLKVKIPVFFFKAQEGLH